MPRGRSPPHRIAKPPCARCSWWAAGGPGGKVGRWALIPWLLWPQCMACFCLKGGRRELGGRKVHSEAQPAAGPAHGLGPTEQRPASAPPPRAAGGAPQVTETRRPNHRGAGSSCPPRSRTGAGTAAGGGRTAASACLRGFAESPPLHLPQISHQIPQAGPHPEQLGGLARLGHLLARATSLRLCPPGLGSPASAPAPPRRCSPAEPGLLGGPVSSPRPSLGAPAALPGCSFLVSGLGWTPVLLQRPCQVEVLTGTSGGKAPSQPPSGTPWPPATRCPFPPTSLTPPPGRACGDVGPASPHTEGPPLRFQVSPWGPGAPQAPVSSGHVEPLGQT